MNLEEKHKNAANMSFIAESSLLSREGEAWFDVHQL